VAGDHVCDPGEAGGGPDASGPAGRPGVEPGHGRGSVNRWPGEASVSFKVDSRQNGGNRNVEGRSVRRFLGDTGNGAQIRQTTGEVAKGG
jgi:hypothetical protein